MSSLFFRLPYVRYNPAHAKARSDLFPHIPPDATHLTFGFKSQTFRVTDELFKKLNLPEGSWLPTAGDYYRFALTPARINGILCSPLTPKEVQLLVQALEESPLSQDEQKYMLWLCGAAYARK